MVKKITVEKNIMLLTKIGGFALARTSTVDNPSDERPLQLRFSETVYLSPQKYFNFYYKILQKYVNICIDDNKTSLTFFV